MALLGAGVIAIFVLVSAVGAWISPYDPIKQDLRFNLETPSIKHLLGTDELGRDIFSRILTGTRISIAIAIASVGVGLLIGVPLGLISGFWGGKVDFILQRITDTMLAFPGFLLSLALVSIIGVGFKNAILHAAGLGFLGLGVQPPTPEWGAMLGTGRAYIFVAPHVATFPGLAIFFAVLGFNLFGDGLRDALDPRFKL